MFTFKLFKIQQTHTAMKVCTDSCLFGALIDTQKHTFALDIGTGTGLLSLMQAQKNQELEIDAIEIDNQACIDAKSNIKNSPFSNKITLFEMPIQELASKTQKKYDLIFSNPPFYENSLLSPSKNKNVAHHTVLLGLEELANNILQLMTDNGKAWIVFPPVSFEKFESICTSKGLFCTEVTDIHHDTEKPCLRKIGVFEKANHPKLTKPRIDIRDKKAYSKRFNELLKDYYLIF
jgi:tRNA1Val (adenine37-N6)-methyltransferase